MNNNFKHQNAFAHIRGSSDFPEITGRIKFTQKKNALLIEADIQGLPDTQSGFFGFHIHQGKSCSGEDFQNTGMHYNPTNQNHPSHLGDLPPLLFCNGGAYLVVATNRLKLGEIIGRTVVIHGMPDDFTSQPAGNAGIKIGCGVIKQL